MEKAKSRKVPDTGKSTLGPKGVERVGQLRDEFVTNHALAFVDDDGSLIEPASQVSRIVDEMVDTGFFGSSQALCVERILCRWIIENAGMLSILGVKVPRLTNKVGVHRGENVNP